MKMAATSASASPFSLSSPSISSYLGSVSGRVRVRLKLRVTGRGRGTARVRVRDRVRVRVRVRVRASRRTSHGLT